jgi:hypothetical protein
MTVLSLKSIQRAVLVVWELPQNTLGALLYGVQRALGNVKSTSFERERVMVELGSIGAISLGLFVFHTQKDNSYVPVGRENKDHEYGHSIQSRLLGPLYLPVVGLMSELRAFYAFGYRHLKGKRWDGYYNGFPEDWADRLGKVDTSMRPKP